MRAIELPGRARSAQSTAFEAGEPRKLAAVKTAAAITMATRLRLDETE
jgi:hypothetical protein